MQVQTFRLQPHPDTPPAGIDGVDVRWFDMGKGSLILRYQIKGVDALVVPPFAGKGRGDTLWQTTCCELFLKDREGAGYGEFNFSPSERWAAYRFRAHRDGMADAELPAAPEVTASGGEYLFVLTATIDSGLLANASAAGLAAVIAEKDGTKSYWALAHPAGQPDFHDPACFALPLPAAGQP